MEDEEGGVGAGNTIKRHKIQRNVESCLDPYSNRWLKDMFAMIRKILA